MLKSVSTGLCMHGSMYEHAGWEVEMLACVTDEKLEFKQFSLNHDKILELQHDWEH